MNLSRLPLLLVAAALLVASAAKPNQITNATLAAGLVVLGAWTAVEVVALWRRRDNERPNDPDKEDTP